MTNNNLSNNLDHVLIIGTTGMGKTNLIFDMIKNDLENGIGFICYDPHSDIKNNLIKNNYLNNNVLSISHIKGEDNVKFDIQRLLLEIQEMNFDTIIERNQILFINILLSGEDKIELLKLIIKKINLSILKRSEVEPNKKDLYKIYLDELGSLINENLKNLVGEAKKHNIELIFSIQFLEELNSKVINLKDLILDLFNKKIIFKLCLADGDYLESENTYFKKDLVKDLEIGNAYVLTNEGIKKISIPKRI